MCRYTQQVKSHSAMTPWSQITCPNTKSNIFVSTFSGLLRNKFAILTFQCTSMQVKYNVSVESKSLCCKRSLLEVPKIMPFEIMNIIITVFPNSIFDYLLPFALLYVSENLGGQYWFVLLAGYSSWPIWNLHDILKSHNNSSPEPVLKECPFKIASL